MANEKQIEFIPVFNNTIKIELNNNEHYNDLTLIFSVLKFFDTESLGSLRKF